MSGMRRVAILGVMVLAACGSRLADAQALAPSSMAPNAAADAPCRSLDLPAATLLRSSPTFAAVPAGSKRFYREDGGWSLLYPASWSMLDWRMRGAQFVSFAPDPRSGSFPQRPADGVSVHVEAWPNEDRLDLDRWLARFFPPATALTGTNEIHTRAPATIGGRPAVTMTAFERIGPPPYVESRIWWVASPYFDRVYRIQAWPADLMREQVDAIVSSFTMLPPTRTSAPLTIDAASAVAEVLAPNKNGGASPVQIAGTKLVRQMEYETAMGFFGFGMEDDPDRLFWLVDATGHFEIPANARGGLSGPAPTPAGGFTQAVFLVDAHRPGIPSVIWRDTGTDWPARFKRTPDRCVR